MTTRRRWLRLDILNVILLALAYAAMVREPFTSNQYRAAIAGGTAFLCVAAALTFSPRLRARLLAVPGSSARRAMLAIAPWIVMTGLVMARTFWWTQRPSGLRVFALYALADWSLAWCLYGPDRRALEAPQRVVLIIAAALGLLGLNGAAFGVLPFGCAVSMLLLDFAVLALATASWGSRLASLKAVTAALAALVAVGALELVVRTLHIGHNVREADSREIAREFYTLTPPHTAFIDQPNVLDEYGPALVSINSRGIRGPELTAPTTDILLLGDSMIEARQLPWDQTLGPDLQSALKARGLPFRVVAHGMRGWSPLLEWNWYLKVGRTLKPKTVFLFFFWNDLWTAGDEVSTFDAVVDANGRPDYFNVPIDSDAIWYKHVRVIRLAGDAWERLTVEQIHRAFTTIETKPTSGRLDDRDAYQLARKLTEPPFTAAQRDAVLHKPENELDPALRTRAASSFWAGMRPLDLWDTAQVAAARKTEIELRRFADDVAAGGGHLVIVYVPNALQVSPEECSIGRLFDRVDRGVMLPADSGIQDWLQGVAARQHITLVDPSAAMREFEQNRPAEDQAPLYLRADCHWSPRGHAFMAQFLANWCQRFLSAH